MRCARVVAVLVAGALGWGCGQKNEQGQAGSGTPAAEGPGETADAVASANDRPLGEFQPLTAADLDIYVKVMREAAHRLANLSERDRQAMQVWRDMSQGAPPATVPSPEQIALMQRAGELATMDATVARELGLAHRFSSISSRVDDFLMPDMGGEGDEPLSPEEKVRVQERIRRFRERDRADSLLLQPHRAEYQTLRRQVRIAAPPVDAMQTE